MVGIEWAATATGQTGYGNPFGTPVIIAAGASASNPFAVNVPDDDVAHSCNRLVVNLRSIMPGKYKIAPYREGQGFISLEYVDNDGGNPDNEPC